MKKTVLVIAYIIMTVFCLFSISTCHHLKSMDEEHMFEFKTEGGHEVAPSFHNPSGTRYIFLSNDIGHFTVPVSQRSYNEVAVEKLDSVSLALSMREMYAYADDDATMKNVVNDRKKLFNVDFSIPHFYLDKKYDRMGFASNLVSFFLMACFIGIINAIVGKDYRTYPLFIIWAAAILGSILSYLIA